MDLDVEAEQRLKAPSEELDALFLLETPSMGKKCLEAILVVRDGARALAGGQSWRGLERSGGP